MNTYILAAQTFNLKIETITVLIQVLIYIGRGGHRQIYKLYMYIKVTFVEHFVDTGRLG